MNDLFYTALGGFVTALSTITIMSFRHYFKKDTKRVDELSLIRLETKLRCDKLEARIEALTEENERWRVKYFTETQKLNEIILSHKQDVTSLTVQLQDVRERFVPKSYRGFYS